MTTVTARPAGFLVPNVAPSPQAISAKVDELLASSNTNKKNDKKTGMRGRDGQVHQVTTQVVLGAAETKKLITQVDLMSPAFRKAVLRELSSRVVGTQGVSDVGTSAAAARALTAYSAQNGLTLSFKSGLPPMIMG